MSETTEPALEKGPRTDVPRFTQGNILRHIVVMSATGGVGLMAIFLVDLLSLLYVSWLGDSAKLAGVGLATTILFFAMSFNIGLMIAISALTAKAIGARDRPLARRLAGSGVAFAVAVAALVAAGLWLVRDDLLALLNARPDSKAIASRYLGVTLPFNVMLALGVAYSAVLRADGDARRAMFVTLGGGVATAFLDPLFIFGLKLDVMGAAYATALTRIIFAAIGYHGAVVVHNLVARPRLKDVLEDAVPLSMIAGPAILTNLAVPVGSAYLARIMAEFGNQAIAATAVIDRLTPLAFGGLFALSGAVGPVLSQNWGAGQFARMKSGLANSLLLSTGYVVLTWLVLIVARNQLVGVFKLDGEAADLVRLYCWISGPAWICIGALFVANASFNNLGFPLLATAFNWGRVLLGMMPFAYLGALYGGPQGALTASLAAGSVFGIGAVWMSWTTLGDIALRGKMPPIGRGR